MNLLLHAIIHITKIVSPAVVVLTTVEYDIFVLDEDRIKVWTGANVWRREPSLRLNYIIPIFNHVWPICDRPVCKINCRKLFFLSFGKLVRSFLRWVGVVAWLAFVCFVTFSEWTRSLGSIWCKTETGVPWRPIIGCCVWAARWLMSRQRMQIQRRTAAVGNYCCVKTRTNTLIVFRERSSRDVISSLRAIRCVKISWFVLVLATKTGHWPAALWRQIAQINRGFVSCTAAAISGQQEVTWLWREREVAPIGLFSPHRSHGDCTRSFGVARRSSRVLASAAWWDHVLLLTEEDPGGSWLFGPSLKRFWPGGLLRQRRVIFGETPSLCVAHFHSMLQIS